MQIDNCMVFVDRAEMPGLDGSSQRFVEALSEAGIKTQHVRRQTLVIDRPVRVGDDDIWLLAEPIPHPHCELRYELSYPDEPAIGEQTFEMVLTPDAFCNQVASARTFVTRSEAELLRQQGLGRRVNYTDILVFDEKGPLQNSLRYPDECARHKLLDMLGDFALSGRDIFGRITARRSGHRLNAELVRQLLAEFGNSSQLKKSA